MCSSGHFHSDGAHTVCGGDTSCIKASMFIKKKKKSDIVHQPGSKCLADQ